MTTTTLPAGFLDGTMSIPELRRAWADARKRVFRKARRQRVAAKEAFLRSAR